MTDVIPLHPPLSELPEAVQALRTERERVFVWTYMLNGANGSKAAKAAGYSDVKEGAKVRAHMLLQREDIQAALRELSIRYLHSLAPIALFKLRKHLNSDNERVSLKATDMVLARTGFSERTALDVTVGGTVTVNHKDAAVADLRRMIALGAPEDKLIEIFGFSGLTRYRKMLAADDAKALPAPIDGEFTEVKR